MATLGGYTCQSRLKIKTAKDKSNVISVKMCFEVWDSTFTKT